MIPIGGRNGMWMRGGFLERDFALAAIAATPAALAEMVVASVLGAEGADSGGFLLADAARKGH